MTHISEDLIQDFLGQFIELGCRPSSSWDFGTFSEVHQDVTPICLGGEMAITIWLVCVW